jgi:hypothetical protein
MSGVQRSAKSSPPSRRGRTVRIRPPAEIGAARAQREVRNLDLLLEWAFGTFSSAGGRHQLASRGTGSGRKSANQDGGLGGVPGRFTLIAAANPCPCGFAAAAPGHAAPPPAAQPE